MSGSARTTPWHREVAAAVERTGDPELAGWVSDPGGYALLPVTLDEVGEHDLFALQPVDVGHPLAVVLARHRPSGGLAVTSGRPAAVWEVLRHEPGPPQPAVVVALLARTWGEAEYVGPVSGDAVQPDDGGWRCDLVVRLVDRDLLQRWTARLTAHDAALTVQPWPARSRGRP